ncbi:hypothetical protein [Candidatus Uabimicrobium sp. HlEnr_7]|uniref:hypothetical protein n=1 Tax=Candidatus Uabimicrobium helgolandensis TaxID=3095367 RepID=UPI003555E5CF
MSCESGTFKVLTKPIKQHLLLNHIKNCVTKKEKEIQLLHIGSKQNFELLEKHLFEMNCTIENYSCLSSLPEFTGKRIPDVIILSFLSINDKKKEFIRSIKKKFQHIPVIVLTDDPLRKNIEQIDGVLVKSGLSSQKLIKIICEITEDKKNES